MGNMAILNAIEKLELAGESEESILSRLKPRHELIGRTFQFHSKGLLSKPWKIVSESWRYKGGFVCEATDGDVAIFVESSFLDGNITCEVKHDRATTLAE